MLTHEQIEKKMDEAESEIKAVLKKHKLSLGMLYSEGVAVTICYQQQHQNGDCQMFEREAF